MISWPSNDYWIKNYEIFSKKKTFDIKNICSLDQPQNNSLLFLEGIKEGKIFDFSFLKDCLIVVRRKHHSLLKINIENNGIIFSENPRWFFAKILEQFWSTKSLRGVLTWDKDLNIYVGENVSIASSAYLEPGVTVLKNSKIGENSYIMSGARIGPNVVIGNDSVIRENSVIGGWGFGFAAAEDEKPLRLPHLGGVYIGNYVEIGSSCTIASGTIESTKIWDYTKINDQVHIAHNCIIDTECLIGACTTISGSTSIGKQVYIAPNVSVINKIHIGDKSFIGIGSVVLKSCENYSVIVGNPGRYLKKNI